MKEAANLGGVETSMERPVTRKLLATFIEYAASGKVTTIEGQRFAVAHYVDPLMEEARRESVRILFGSRGRAMPRDQRDALLTWADRLRSGN